MKSDKIFGKITPAINKYLDFICVCDEIANEVLEHIDWSDNVICRYHIRYGLYIIIEEHICDVFTFCKLIEKSEDDMVDKQTYIDNCI
jgi:hypothetical protein